MDWLVHAEHAVRGAALSERCGRQQPEGPGQHARLVRQDVAEQVLGDEHVELGRPLDEQHRARVDELVVELDVRVFGGHFVGDPPPEPRRREDIRLIDAGHATAASPSQLERKAHDPGDLVFRVRQRVTG